MDINVTVKARMTIKGLIEWKASHSFHVAHILCEKKPTLCTFERSRTTEEICKVSFVQLIIELTGRTPVKVVLGDHRSKI